MTWAFSVTSNIPQITQSGTDSGLAGISTAIAAVSTVAVSTAYAVTQMVKPPAANGMWYRCSTAGTTAATAPLYNPVAGSTTTDGTAVFTAFLAPDVRLLGTQYLYYMPDIRFNITGTLTNANPQITSFVCWDLLLSASTSVFTSGTWASDGVTPLYDGFHFIGTRVSSNPSDNASGSFQVQLGTATFIGGEVQVAGAIGINAGATLNTYYTRWHGTKQWGGVTSTRVRSYSNTSIWRQCELYDMAFDRFNSPAEFSAKARKSEYLIQYVSSVNGGVNAKFTASGVENIDGSYDFDNYGSGWVELYNCAKGANLNVTTQQPTTAIKNTFFVPLFQDISITAKNTSGTVVQDVRFTCTDVPNNSPTATITTYDGLKTWDYRSPLTYQTTTNASGIATSTPSLQAWWFNGTAIQKNLRFPSSTATFEGRAYNYKTMTTSVVLGSSSVQTLSAGMISLDTATTITETAALALTGIALTPSGATGGSIVVSSNRTLQDIWNYYRAWINQFANRASNDTWSCIGGKLTTGLWIISIAPNVTLSTSTNITILESSTVSAGGSLFDVNGVWTASGVWTATMVWGVQEASSTAAFSNISIIGNVLQATPTNLTNVNITGNLTYNTNSNVTVTLTGCTVTGTISNAGTGTVTVTSSGSTFGTVGANVVTRLVGTYTITGLLSGSSVYIADNTGAQVSYVASSGTSFSYDATGGTGTWVAKVRKYGQQDQAYTFTPASGASTQVASYLPDTFVVASLATAQAYTDLNTFQKVYDYSRYFGTTVAAMPFSQLFNKGFGTLTANYPYTLDPAAAAVMATGITSKTSGFAESGTLIVSGNFTQGTATLTNDVQIRATNFDSELLFTGIDAITIYATQNDAFTNTSPGAYSNTGIVRFLYGAVLSGVTMSGTVYLRTEIGSVVEIQAVTLTAGTTTLSLSTVVLLQKALLDLTEIKGKTNSLTFTVAGVVDSNIQYVNDVEVKGVGSDNDPWNPV